MQGQTRHPIVLVPGLLGFVRLAGFPYWYGIDRALRQAGARVYPVQLSPLHGTELRGAQLLERIGELLAASGAEKVNLIGHSQGALAARYAAAHKPAWVASVTSVAGPNHGSELADYLERRVPREGLGGRLLTGSLQGLARLMGWLESGGPRHALPLDGLAAHRELTSEGVAAFNSKYPQGLPLQWGGEGAAEVEGVRYYSWSGTLQPGLTDRGRNRLDATQAMCRALSRCFLVEAGQNDGLVGRYSSHLGLVIRSDYPLDHLDIVNQTAGAVGRGIDPVRLFVEHAARLREAGL
jgi:triacylglycerol lipase